MNVVDLSPSELGQDEWREQRCAQDEVPPRGFDPADRVLYLASLLQSGARISRRGWWPTASSFHNGNYTK